MVACDGMPEPDSVLLPINSMQDIVSSCLDVRITSATSQLSKVFGLDAKKRNTLSGFVMFVKISVRLDRIVLGQIEQYLAFKFEDQPAADDVFATFLTTLLFAWPFTYR